MKHGETLITLLQSANGRSGATNSADQSNWKFDRKSNGGYIKTIWPYLLVQFIVAPLTMGLVMLLAMPLTPSKVIGDRKSNVFHFRVGLVAGIAVFCTAILVFRWLGRTPSWPLPVMLFASLALYNMDMVSKFSGHPGATEEASEGIGNCLGIIAGAVLFYWLVAGT